MFNWLWPKEHRHRKHHHHQPCFLVETGTWYLTVDSDGPFTVSLIGGKLMFSVSQSIITVFGVTLLDANGNPANLSGVSVAWSIDNAAVGSFAADAVNPLNGDFTPGTDTTDIGNISAAVSMNGAILFTVTAQVQVQAAVIVSGPPASGTINIVGTMAIPAPPATPAS